MRLKDLLFDVKSDALDSTTSTTTVRTTTSFLTTSSTIGNPGTVFSNTKCLSNIK